MEKINYLTEVKPAMTALNALEESSRCLLCHDAPCSKACPADTRPADFIRSIRFKDIKGAVETIRRENPLGGCCARICPCDKLCEQACARTGIDRTIDIGGLQRFATDYEMASGMKVLKAPKATLEKIAILGSGPAGLAAAAELAMMGYRVTVFEEKENPGGILSYGIVPSRLPQEVVDFEVELVRGLGVEFRCNTRIGRDRDIEDLKKEGFSAFCIAVGLQASSCLDVPGAGLNGVVTATEFLAAAKPSNGSMKVPENVVITGGGDVAMDCATTARDLGARHVTLVYRRTIPEMPANTAEIEHVRKLGIPIIPEFSIREIIGKEGRVVSVKCIGLDWTDRDHAIEREDCTLQIRADLLIQAIGQKPEGLSYTGVKTGGKGLVPVDASGFATNVEGVYAIGDIVNGGKTVVEAVAHGKAAASAINGFLSGKRNAGGASVVQVYATHSRGGNKTRDLSVDFLGIQCENPFFLASSPVGSNYEMCKSAFEAGWGGICYKTIGYWIPQECSPRFDATRKEGTSFVGFKNMEMISDKPTEKNLEMMSRLKREFPDKVLIASIMGENEAEWVRLAKAVEEVGCDVIELNLSCPQMTVSSMGSDVGTNNELVEKYCRAVKQATRLPVIAKMTPNITTMELAARTAVRGGADGIAAINTLKSITEIDLDHLTCLPVINGKSSISGYSGKAVMPVAMRFIAQLAGDPQLAGIPISGMGGIETWSDALQFMLLGATTVQVCTAVMQYGYRIVGNLIGGVSHWMDEKGISSLGSIIGKALPNIVPVDRLERDFKVYPAFLHEKCIGCGRCYLSCMNGGHQAIDWDSGTRRPVLNRDKCVGCGLCGLICPVPDCIVPGEVKFQDEKNRRPVTLISKKI